MLSRKKPILTIQYDFVQPLSEGVFRLSVVEIWFRLKPIIITRQNLRRNPLSYSLSINISLCSLFDLYISRVYPMMSQNVTDRSIKFVLLFNCYVVFVFCSSRSRDMIDFAIGFFSSTPSHTPLSLYPREYIG